MSPRMSPSLKKKKSQKSCLIKAVTNNDTELVKCLVDSPEMYKVNDRKGNNLLQLAIMKKSFDVFDYLLSIEDFPLELTNRKGYTALETALDKPIYYTDWDSDMPEYFAKELIRKGANIYRPLLLHCAIISDFQEVIRLLIENGVDLNGQDRDGLTPLNVCIRCNIDVEVMLMILHYGADLFVVNRRGRTLFDEYVLMVYDNDKVYDLDYVLLQNLVYCNFDEFGKYKIPFDTSIYALDSKFCFFFFDHIFGSEYVSQVEIVRNEDNQRNVALLFKSGPANLIAFIDLYSDVLTELLLNYDEVDFFNDSYCLNYCYCSDYDSTPDCDCVWWEDIDCEIFDELIESKLRSETISFIANLNSTALINNLCKDKIPEAKATELVCYLLSYGLNLHDTALELTYRRFGFCELFKICLYMDLYSHPDFTVDHVMPRLIIDVTVDVQEYIEDPSKCSVKDLRLLLDHCADPKLQKYCRGLEDEELTGKVDGLPQVPRLEELARNAFRRYFIKRCNITSAKEFFRLLELLPISVVFQKIISFETKLYP